MAKMLYAATHRFDSPIRVGSHHLAKLLCESHDLLYLSHPVSLASLLNPADNQLASRMRPRSGASADVDGLQELTPKFVVAPGNRFPLNTSLVLDHAWRTSVPTLRSQLKRRGAQAPDWLFLDSLYQTFWPAVVSARHLGIRIADSPEGLGGFSKALTERWRALLSRADVVIAPSDRTADWAMQNGATVVDLCPNGVDLDHFRRSLNEHVPPELEDQDGPVAVFVGAIARWIDMELLKGAAARLPEVTFLIIGPMHVAEQQRSGPPNLHWLGSRPYNEIPGYLAHADVALAPFNVSEYQRLIEATSAIKLYEYLAAGLPVAATRWSQSESLADHIVLAQQSADSFASAITECLNEPPTPPTQQAIESWSWRKRLEIPLQRIQSN